MGDVKASFGMVLVSILLILSYNYVVDEIDTAATADPTNSLLEFMNEVFPIIYAVIVFGSVAVTAYVVYSQVK